MLRTMFTANDTDSLQAKRQSRANTDYSGAKGRDVSGRW
ncbi:MAG: hypothetical protein JG782_1752 [Anaerophaga sp.]|jgi:hypothetical protein|nr:hypothetical protein [Anaerophaga sp.]MDK2842809.1 hypothetical protein [Anaerophaga sp.]